MSLIPLITSHVDASRQTLPIRMHAEWIEIASNKRGVNRRPYLAASADDELLKYSGSEVVIGRMRREVHAWHLLLEGQTITEYCDR